jgi:uncharacterized CHY-type Zn-finger protein
MLINKRCTVCHNDIEPRDSVVCGTCKRSIHGRCAEFERRFECPDCADELDVGAVEFR